MSVKIFCDVCQIDLEIDDSAAGQIIKCPQCDNDYFVEPTESAAMKKECPYCGEEVLATAKKCKHCGEFLVMTHEKMENLQKSKKRILPLLLIFIFLGWLGIHYFYSGKTGSGFLVLFLFLFSWLVIPGILLIVLLVVNFFQIITGNFVDVEGKKITEW